MLRTRLLLPRTVARFASTTATRSATRPRRNSASPSVPLPRAYSSTVPRSKTVSITYVEPDGTEKTVDAEIGKNLMEIAHDHNVELEGACGGELACSTCHLIFEHTMYNTLPKMEDDEVDMLDLAFEVTDTSRLGCQILVREDMEGMKVRIPNDGF